MGRIVEMLQMSGWAGYAELAVCMMCSPIGLAALLVSGMYLAKRQPNTRRAAMVVAGIAMLGGAMGIVLTALGYFMGNQNVEEAVVFADPAIRDALLAAGREELQTGLTFGCTLSSGPFMMGLLALVMAMPPPKPAGSAEII